MARASQPDLFGCPWSCIIKYTCITIWVINQIRKSAIYD
ncbi:protein of unknown function [Limnospira indica PCC 8005]|uniref:Uncharacterized protein n=1 Tax=Limnospira indica PCC 8005 TaxID=376219 RepID=A0A9P1NXR0_9CYAN|nr:protein of unknown function [Limnospira indica PCC 8005]